jgi:hypothetical protein
MDRGLTGRTILIVDPLIASEIPTTFARERIEGDERRARLQESLRRSEDRIEQSRTRIAEHAALMERIDRSNPGLYALSRDLHSNLEAGLQFLMHTRAIWLRELQYIERRRADAMGTLAMVTHDRTDEDQRSARRCSGSSAC